MIEFTVISLLWILPAVICPWLAICQCKNERWVFLWAFLFGWLGGGLALAVLEPDEEKLAARDEANSPKRMVRQPKKLMSKEDYERLLGGKRS